MKTCPVCALDLEDAYLFCPDDGSSLGTLPNRSTESRPANAFEPDDETAEAVVLYCPACAAEYPLTFSTCPVHGVQLIKHRIPRLSNGAQELREHDRPVEPQALVAGLGLERDQAKLTRPLTTPDGNERGFERRDFRVAAIATVIALAAFALVALYTLVSSLSRRSSTSTVQTASKTQSALQPRPFVPTPQEAQDFREAPGLPASTPPEPQTEQPVERARSENPSSSPTERGVRKTPVAEPLPRAAAPTAPATTTRISNPPMPALPRGASGGFDARLIRVRSRKTPAGVRYDLTFNMQEEAGRSAQWQRVLISTRSASGTSHSEAIPFSHRLGAAGALTFTISVELTGRSEADWRGRIVCSALGWDNKGAPLQASFGADVTP